MPSFFIAPEDIHGDTIIISGATAHHIKNVLRLKPGAVINLLSGSKLFWESQIEDISKDTVCCRIISSGQAKGEPPLQIVLVQGLAKGDKMDTIVQKGTELGAVEFWPVFCKRSILRLDEVKKESRRKRWQKIALEAAQQCRRAAPPLVEKLQDWSTAVSMIPKEALTLALWENETGYTLKEALQERSKPQKIYLLIGPEGGLEESEVAQACNSGAITVSLGPRILRTETAGPAALVMLLYQWGDLGG